MLPHLIDERVDVCYGETAEHIAMRQQLRERLQQEGIYMGWLDNNHVHAPARRARICAPGSPSRATAKLQLSGSAIAEPRDRCVQQPARQRP